MRRVPSPVLSRPWWRVPLMVTGWVFGALATCPGQACAGEPFRWVARPVVVPAGQTARLTLDLHVPAGVDAIEYEVEVSSSDEAHFQVGPLELAHGRWDRPAHEVDRSGRLPLHLPMTAAGASPGVHRVVLQAKVRTCTGRACADGREAEVPVVVHVTEQVPAQEGAMPSAPPIPPVPRTPRAHGAGDSSPGPHASAGAPSDAPR